MYGRNQSVAFFQTIFQRNEFQNIFIKKINKFGLNYHRYMVQPLVLHILKCSFLKYQRLKISHLEGYFSSGSLHKFIIIVLFILSCVLFCFSICLLNYPNFRFCSLATMCIDIKYVWQKSVSTKNSMRKASL